MATQQVTKQALLAAEDAWGDGAIHFARTQALRAMVCDFDAFNRLSDELRST